MAALQSLQRVTLVLAACGMLAAAAWSLWFGGSLVVADFPTTASRQLALQCDKAGQQWPDETWKQVQEDLQWAAAVTPGDAARQDLLALLASCEGKLNWQDDPERLRLYQRAVVHLDESLALRPHHATTLAHRAVALYATGAAADALNEVWAEALQYGPNVRANHPALLFLALQTWPQATPAMRAWVLQQHNDAEPVDRRWLEDLAESLERRDVLP